jgi:hypothetical protein
MKVALGYRPVDGPWGGGNRFAVVLAAALRRTGHEVVYALCENHIDIILLTDPRCRHPSAAFGPGAVLRYLLLRNPRALVVHRINECDERKNSRGMNRLLRRANYCADHTVFVGTWLKDLPLWECRPDARYSVITNGADTGVFNREEWSPWRGHGALRLVTHHWGGNWMKGFDIYQRLDEMLAEPAWKGRIEFTYVGNLPRGFAFRNARYVAPLDGKALAAELRTHHAYVTASMNEPGGNHQNEGALCGLPLLYRRSGCLPEYCDGFGVSFDKTDFESSLQQLIAEYDSLVAAMTAYPHTAERTCANYLALFDELIKSRNQILASRHLWRNPWLLLRHQLPF